MELLTQFGVDWRLLFAQIVNFAILLFILKKILYKPILQMLEERKMRIAEAEENALSIEKRLEKIEKEREKVIEKASLESTALLEEATKSAAEIVAESHEKAAIDIKVMVEKAKEQIVLDQEKMRREIRQEFGDLLASAMTAVYAKKLTKGDQEQIVREALKGKG